MPEQRHVVTVSAVIRRGEQILLVRQRGAGDTEDTWALPGGVVEPGELPTEALLREVREETGLRLVDVGHVLYVKAGVDSSGASRGTTFVFDLNIADSPVNLKPEDPDGDIREARFFTVADAIERLQRLPRPMMRDPLIAHLQGKAGPGALWLYRYNADGDATLVSVVGAAMALSPL